ncbi:MAG TPA: alpha/beta hydrolase [Candidatus Sulfotelmatobacter sp.]|nr:alpha/beta hydrolase [Candidatus Sulfotelmatobacter sp.]
MKQWMAEMLVIALAASGAAQSNPSAPKDAATFDPDGTAHITRVVPVPTTVSKEAQAWLESLNHGTSGPETLAERRARTDQWRAKDSAEARRLYPVNVEEATTGGVRTDIITPLSMPEANRNRVLINLHGGGFNSDSGSLIEGVPIAHLAKIRVVSVYYRLAPENPFPAAVDDVVAVYRELLKTYQPRRIGIFGTSAGAILTAEVTVRLKQLGLPLPGALGIFSALADFSRVGDTRQLFTLNGFPGPLQPTDSNHLPDDQYVGKTDRRDPVLSPVYADLHGMPPSLLVTSTRDLLLSDTVIFHRALLRAGNESLLVVFEALPHAFWYHFQLPETGEALELMAKFLDERVSQ